MAGRSTSGPGAPSLRPPVPERRPVRLEAHGDVRIDDWYWLRDKDDPAVIEHLEAENAYTEAAMSGTDRPPPGPVRRDGGPDRGDRPVGAGPQGSLALLRAHRGGQQLRHPLPARRFRPEPRAGSTEAGPATGTAAPTAGHAPGGRGGPAGRERTGRGPRVLRRGEPRGEPGPPLAGLLHRHHRRRALHHALRRSRPPAGRLGRGPRGHLLRRGLGQRQRHRLLRAGGRGHAPLPGLAAPGRHRAGRGRPGLRGAGPPLLRRGRADQGRPVRADRPGLQGDLGVPGPVGPTTPRAGSR